MFRMSAFRDGHAHPLFAGREALGPRLDGLGSIAQIQAEVERFAKANPGLDWIVGGAYDRSLAPSFMAEWIDEVVSDRPVVLHASDHHTIWVNHKALERAGVLESFPEVATGFADLDEFGRPTGTLRESGAMDIVLEKIPALGVEGELLALDWAQNELLSVGIAQVQDAWIEKGMAEVYLEALARKRLKVATNLAFRITPENKDSDKTYIQGLAKEIESINSPLLKAKTVKFFVDGVLGSGTAMVHEPYQDGSGHGDPVWDAAEFFKTVSEYAALGFQLHIHAIGDAGVTQALDAIERVGRTSLPSVIAHAELVDPKDIPRFKTLGVIANYQPLWARPDGMLTSCQPKLGQSRIDKMYPIRTLMDAGAKISFGSDWPVSSVNPLLGIQTAVTRSYLGSSHSPEEAISLTEAIHSYTTAVEEQLGWSLGEQVILSQDPSAVPLDEISEIQVIELWRGKDQIH